MTKFFVLPQIICLLFILNSPKEGVSRFSPPGNDVSSPLLRSQGQVPVPFNPREPPPALPRHNQLHQPQNSPTKSNIYQRLGSRTSNIMNNNTINGFPQKRDHSHFNKPQQPRSQNYRLQKNSNDSVVGFYQKAPSDDGVPPPKLMKRNHPNRNPFYDTNRDSRKPQDNANTGFKRTEINLAQSRMNRIRSSVDNSRLSPPPQNEPQHIFKQNPYIRNPPLNANRLEQISNDDLNTSLDDLDAQDITVEVVNDKILSAEEDDDLDTRNLNLTRFKMVLDDRTQAAIRRLQSAQKEKQVIVPSPVTPHVTDLTMNSRFASL